MSRTENDTARILNREYRRKSDGGTLTENAAQLLACGCRHHVDGQHTPWRIWRPWAQPYSAPEYIRADVIRAVCIVHAVPVGTWDIPTKVTLPSHF